MSAQAGENVHSTVRARTIALLYTIVCLRRTAVNSFSFVFVGCDLAFVNVIIADLCRSAEIQVKI